MRLLLFVFLTATAVSCQRSDSNGSEKEKITEGEYAVISQAPYQAQILQYRRTICGAAIISEYWLISAAHCFTNVRSMTVMTGATERAAGGVRHRIEKIVIHKEYNDTTSDCDISLIKLTKPIEFNNDQQPIKLSRDPPQVGEKMIISGYGKEGDYKTESPVLKIATVPVIDESVCAERYRLDPITENMFCAGNGSADACQGDSGGPAVINNKLAGIVSTGMDCGSNYYPGVYTKVYKYFDWVMQHI